MSVIVAIKEKGKVYFGCDSQVSNSRSKFTLTNSNNFKIWKMKKFESIAMVGGVGSLRDINIIRVESELIDELSFYKDIIDFDYVVSRVVPKMFEILAKYERLSKDSDCIKYMNSSYLISIKSNIYEIGMDGSVIEVDDYTAIGSGQDIALGSLNTSLKLSPKERIIKAIQASCKTNLYVNYPIVITSTDSDEVTLIHSDDIKD